MDSTSYHVCPFCGFRESDDYRMLLHVEIFHSENGDSPFAVKDSVVPSSRTSTPNRSASPISSTVMTTFEYIDCPHRCGERIPAAEMQFHTDFHMAETLALEDAGADAAVETSIGQCNDEEAIKDIANAFSTGISKSLRNHGQSTSETSTTNGRRWVPSLKELFFGTSHRKRVVTSNPAVKLVKVKRLGTAELGPYAHEARMPTWMEKMLEEGAKVTISNTIGPNGKLIRIETIANETPGLIPVLARLSVRDRSVARAYYCAPEVRLVVKMPREGGFCGYRNIQMLISYISDARALGCEHFPGRLPSIIKLQDMIENAWDMGYYSNGRIETGGIRSTRKYIGTCEALALFQSLQIPSEAVMVTSRGGGDVFTMLMVVVFKYFEDEENCHDGHRVFITKKPPIYLQHAGHSMTIVGVEVHKNGSANLVVFDPVFNPSQAVKSLIGMPSFHCLDPGRMLKAYRRGEDYLSKFRDFELLKLSSASSDQISASSS